MALKYECDVAVLGGGIVGSAIAWGLNNLGLSVCIVDEGDRAFRASRGNFGMVWVQGKGSDFTPYADLTRIAANEWAAFDARLKEASGSGADFYQPGGFGFCLSEKEFETKAATMEKLHLATGGQFQYEMRRPSALKPDIPWLGKDVVGAVYCPHDGGANPLKLLNGLQTALKRAGALFLHNLTLSSISAKADGTFVVTAGEHTIRARKVVLSAGLGNKKLAEQVGLLAPVQPVRGQIMVTERIPPLMHQVSSVFRQTSEGSCLIGDTMEEVGYDEGVTIDGLELMAARAVRVCPLFQHVNVVRSWGALRVMTPDGLPIYQESTRYPGAWLATVHSGITLAPVHATLMASTIAAGEMPPLLRSFSASRFAVQGTFDQKSSH